MLPQMSGYIKCLDYGSKNMLLEIRDNRDNNVLVKYNEIWDGIN